MNPELNSPPHALDPAIHAPAANASTLELIRTLLREGALYARDLSQMFSAELTEKARSLRTLAMLGGAAALFLLFSFCLLSFALVGALAYGLASWRWALLIVGVGWGIIGMFLLLPVAHALQHGLFKFEHTQRRLKEDSEWVKDKLAA